jgi:hypothetical protein
VSRKRKDIKGPETTLQESAELAKVPRSSGEETVSKQEGYVAAIVREGAFVHSARRLNFNEVNFHMLCNNMATSGD